MTERYRVLRVIARLNIGGPARHVATLSRGLTLRGFDTVLLYGSVDADESDGEHLVADVRRIRLPELGRRIRPWSDLKAFVKVLRILFREQPDVVDTHTSKAGTVGRFAGAAYNALRSRGRRAVMVHTYHGHVFQGYFGPITGSVIRGIERALGRLTDCIVVLSAKQRDDIVNRYRIAPASKVVIVPLGLELDDLLSLEERPAASTGVVFGYVGRFAPIKDLPLLLRAFADVRIQVPQARLRLVGDGERRDELKILAGDLGISEAVEFCGWERRLKMLYDSLDAVVLSSRNEGTPMVLIEAMAAGRVVIATAVGGVPDVVRDGVTGLLVPSGDQAALATAMLLAARSRATRQRLGSAAREFVRERYRADRLLRDMSALYGTLLRRVHGVTA